jgi:hypothetical protein
LAIIIYEGSHAARETARRGETPAKTSCKTGAQAKGKGGENTGVNVVSTMAGLGLIDQLAETTEAVSAISPRSQAKHGQVCLKAQNAIKPRELYAKFALKTKRFCDI